MFGRQDLIWDGSQLQLLSNRSLVLASIEPDQIWPACGVFACRMDTSPTWSTCRGPRIQPLRWRSAF